MPELPEVQTVVDDLNAAGIVGKIIRYCRVRWQRSIATPSSREFCRRIQDQTITCISRRAKYIIFELINKQYIVIHLRMTGRLHLVKSQNRLDKHEHVILELNNQYQLRFHDTRKFGRFYLVDDLDPLFAKLGPEPLDSGFRVRELVELIGTRQRAIKPLLLDQTFIAGLGNIYADEALWTARIHPLRPANSLKSEEVRALHHAIQKVLRIGLQNAGTTLGNGKGNFYSPRGRQGRNRDHLNVSRRTAQVCSRCGETIERMVVAQRGTYLCVQCQV